MDDAVFASNIARGQKPLNNKLYDLLDLNPAQPLQIHNKYDNQFEFQPKFDKYYEPKKRNIKPQKVKTVRDIRKEFEEDLFSYLPEELEKKEKYLLKKIRGSSSRNEDTALIAEKLLKSEEPVNKHLWQMISNINPNKKLHPIQFVLCNSQFIRINGSRGGEKKFLINFDLAKRKFATKKKNNKKKIIPTRSIIHKSLDFNFKPGPLTRKTDLDISYQKFNVGVTELINLPKIGLEIQPLYGSPLEPTINNVLNTFREVSGSMTEKWTEFAVSALGTFKNGVAKQDNVHTIVFDLSYKNNQNVILMRNSNNINKTTESVDAVEVQLTDNNDLQELHALIDDMLDAVEISINQDAMFKTDDVDDQNHKQDLNSNQESNVKIKNTKRKYGELEKLDVTVIRLSNGSEPTGSIQHCNNDFCSMGCLCSSIACINIYKDHCGKLDCMFDCKCDFTKYKNIEDAESLSDLINLEKINSGLAKEEQKFHQTVVVTEDKSIVLKSQRRNLKPSRRYTEFLNRDCKTNNVNKILTIDLLRLPCENVEVFCMVHHLYKCFCKGKFVDTCWNMIPKVKGDTVRDENTESDTKYSKKTDSRHYQPCPNEIISVPIPLVDDHNLLEEIDMKCEYRLMTCARIRLYKRKYDKQYYIATHHKIKSLEENDNFIQDKLLKRLHSESEGSDLIIERNDCLKETHQSFVTDATSNSVTETEIQDNRIPNTEAQYTEAEESRQLLPSSTSPQLKYLPNKEKLVTWLELNYKHYKQRLQMGKKKMPLEAPKLGKVALYPWEIILERYKLKKNYFVVTRSAPYRIFMAVDMSNPFFANCINIDNIPFQNINLYPITVRNLLQDADDMNNNFYILCGLPFCWELIGSVTKLTEKTNSDENEIKNKESNEQEERSDCRKNVPINNDSVSSNESVISDSYSTTCNLGPHLPMSKWFIMSIEKDFTEIQFQQRGFFVKYENIMKAINVARSTGKTVRLSSQKYDASENNPQFGIYAIPNLVKSCVFIGPYERNENLGIETVKTNLYNKLSQNTRGFWICTNKLDNAKVIDNPMSFIPKTNLIGLTLNAYENNEIHAIEDISKEANTTLDSIKSFEHKELSTKEDFSKNEKIAIETKEITDEPKDTLIKVIKPITIKKNSNFYKLVQEGRLKPISILKHNAAIHHTTVAQSEIFSDPNLEYIGPIPIIKDTFSLAKINTLKSPPKKPIAEIAPQIKTTSKQFVHEMKKNSGMHILKPEEINKRLNDSTLFPIDTIGDMDEDGDGQNMDVDSFLAHHDICKPPIEEKVPSSLSTAVTKLTSSPVWIQCKNMDIGWIKGKKDDSNKISFEFPGFKFTDFYTEGEAFEKINQVLSRKVYIPGTIELQWEIVDIEENLKNTMKLNTESMGPDYFVKKSGRLVRRDVILEDCIDDADLASAGPSRDHNAKPYLRSLISAIDVASSSMKSYKKLKSESLLDEARHLINYLETEDTTLQEEKQNLEMDISLRKSELLNLWPQASKKKITVSDVTEVIESDSDDME